MVADIFLRPCPPKYFSAAMALRFDNIYTSVKTFACLGVRKQTSNSEKSFYFVNFFAANIFNMNFKMQTFV